MKKMTTLKLRSLFASAAILLCLFTNAQNNIGIGTAPNASAKLDVSSTTQGMLIPRMTAAQRNAITTPATGLLVFQIDNTQGFYFYNGTAWVVVGAPSATLLPNASTFHPSPSGAVVYVTPFSNGLSQNTLLQVQTFVVPAAQTLTVEISSYIPEAVIYEFVKVTPSSTTANWSVNAALGTSFTASASSGGVPSVGTFTCSAAAGDILTIRGRKSDGTNIISPNGGFATVFSAR